MDCTHLAVYQMMMSWKSLLMQLWPMILKVGKAGGMKSEIF